MTHRKLLYAALSLFLACSLLAHAQLNTSFGTVNTVPVTHTLSYQNITGDPWINPVGTSSGAFGISGQALPPGGSGNIFVTFNPSINGTYSGTPSITYVSGLNRTKHLTITANSTGTYVALVAGKINPKYVVLGVTYAPPGHTSFVQYTSSVLVGNTTSLSSSFTSQTMQSISVSGTAGAGVPGIAAGGVTVTGTASTSYTQGSSSSSSVSVTKQTTVANTTPGPASDFVGVNHDYDLIWVWLNPLLRFTFNPSSPNSIQWNGYAYDTTDQPAMEVISIPVGYLNGHFGVLPPDIAGPVARAWAVNQTWPAGEGPALTLTDFANILGADPFGANPSYVVTLVAGSNPATTTDGRFTIVNGTRSVPNFLYQQAAPGGGPGTQAYSEQNTTTTTTGQGTTHTFQQAFGIEEKFTGNTWVGSLTFDLQQSQTLTWTNTWNRSTTNTTSETNQLSITGPTCSPLPPCVPLYTGHSEFDVYQDNLYGTYMFWGVN